MTEPTPRAPRIAFFGAMANNCYMAASRLHELGVDVAYIIDDTDMYAISNPVWEDCRMWLSYDDLTASSAWSCDIWRDLAISKSWRRPTWVIDPKTHPGVAEPDFSRIEKGRDELSSYVPAPADHYRNILHIMNGCDLVFVSNVPAMILALLSTTDLVICPAGGEFMMATGQLTGKGDVGRTLEKQRRLTMAAFQIASATVTNTPFLEHSSLTAGLRNLLIDFDPIRFKRVSLPFVARARLAAEPRRRLLNETLAEVGIASVDSRFAVLVPSRIDYTWKGQDALLAALPHLTRPDDFTFMFSGWGSDFFDFRRRTEGLSSIRVMNCAVSKPILLDLAAGSDLVVDQFKLGHIGTAAREAASVGAPVMSWIAQKPWAWYRKPDLPVINVRDAMSIARSLNDISAGTLDLDAVSDASLAWIRRFAAPQRMADALNSLIKRPCCREAN